MRVRLFMILWDLKMLILVALLSLRYYESFALHQRTVEGAWLLLNNLG